MPVTGRSASINTQLSSSAADIVAEVASNTVTAVVTCTFRNTGGSSRTVTVYKIPSGGSAATGTELAVRAIPAGKQWRCLEAINERLEAGQKLQAKQDAGTDVNAIVSVDDIT